MLVDTNVLLRILQPHHPDHDTAAAAVSTLNKAGRELHTAPQNLVEVWAVATRPVSENGLGMDPEQAAAALTRLKDVFTLISETPAIYPIWEALVLQYRVSGKPTHDARLVAAMQVHGLTSVLTFDRSGFTRYRGIEVVHPAEVQPTAH